MRLIDAELLENEIRKYADLKCVNGETELANGILKSLSCVKNAPTVIEDVDINRLAEICEAEREGKLVVLPCEVGDTVYTLEERCGNEWVEDINCGFCDIGLYGNKDTCCKELAVRKTVVEDPFNFKYSDDMYTSQREAEKALAEMEANNENNND